MPITQETFWIVKCDSCNNYLDALGDKGMLVWHTEEDAKQALNDESYWFIEGNGHIICPDCYYANYYTRNIFSNRIKEIKKMSDAYCENNELIQDMKKIFKYKIPLKDKFIIDLPQDAEILTVQIQFGGPHMWAIVNANPAHPTETRVFTLIGTGHSIKPRSSEIYIYINTFQFNEDRLVFHLFEIKPRFRQEK
jgi:hypothetical protein